MRHALALLLLAAACGPSAEDAERDRVLRAADALRDAPGAAIEPRRRLLAELERQPAAYPAAALARDTCVEAYRHMLDADETSLDIQRAVEAGDAARQGLAEKLGEAEADLAEAKRRMPDCERALADLRRPRASAR